MKHIYILLITLLAVLFTAKSNAQAPANDDCSGAIALTVASGQAACSPTTANTVAATTALYTSNCWSTSFDDDVWYSFTATSTTVMLDITNLSAGAGAGSIGYALFDSPCSSAEITCGQDAAALSGLTVGNTYLLSLFYVGTTDRGTFDICMYEVPPPSNDDCTGAISITPAADQSSCSATSTTIIASTVSSQTGSCAGVAIGDVWYSFVANGTTLAAQASNQDANLTDIGFTLYSGSCGSLTEVSCSATNPSVFTNLTSGTTYYLQAFSTTSGTFDLCVYGTLPPPVNDNCSGAISITVASSQAACSPTTANTSDATTASYTSNCWLTSYDDDVWYSFTATSATVMLDITNLSASAGSVGYALFDSPCSSAEITCGQDAAAFSGLTVGNTYLLSLFYVGTADRGTFDVCLYGLQPPSNDDCAGAVSITPAADQSSCVATSTSLIASTISSQTGSCAGGAIGDVWYSFVANGTTLAAQASNQDANLTDIGFTLYSGSCGSLTEVSCSATNPSSFTNLTSGATYYLQAFSSTSGTFDLCVYGVLPPPVNDDCSGAITVPVKHTQASCSPTTVNTTNATTATYTSNCWLSSYDDDMWYTFIATDTILNIDVSNLSASAGTIGYSVFDTNCSGTEVYCNSFAGTDTIHGLTINNTYFLSIFYFGTTDRGTFDFCLYDNNTTGIDEINTISNVTLYPNPATGSVNVTINANKNKAASLIIADVTGRVAYQESYQLSNANFKKSIDVSSFAKGIYFVEITSGNSKLVKKLVIE